MYLQIIVRLRYMKVSVVLVSEGHYGAAVHATAASFTLLLNKMQYIRE